MCLQALSTKDHYNLRILFGGFEDTDIVFCSQKCLNVGVWLGILRGNNFLQTFLPNPEEVFSRSLTEAVTQRGL